MEGFAIIQAADKVRKKVERVDLYFIGIYRLISLKYMDSFSALKATIYPKAIVAMVKLEHCRIIIMEENGDFEFEFKTDCI
jgi:hypothetical protein